MIDGERIKEETLKEKQYIKELVEMNFPMGFLEYMTQRPEEERRKVLEFPDNPTDEDVEEIAPVWSEGRFRKFQWQLEIRRMQYVTAILQYKEVGLTRKQIEDKLKPSVAKDPIVTEGRLMDWIQEYMEKK